MMYVGSLGRVVLNERKHSSDLVYCGMIDNADSQYYCSLIHYEKLDIDKEAYPDLYKKFKDYPPQPVVTINSENGYRLRAELIVLNDNNQILINMNGDRDFGYELPGGGIDSKEPVEKAAKRECEEEALIICNRVKFMNIAYISKYIPKKINTGAVSLVCVGRYVRPYKGYVKKIDRDEIVNHLEWKDIDSVNLGEPHKLAIERYLKMGY